MRTILVITLVSLFGNVYAAQEEAVFSGGSFWYMQADFDKLKGVESTITGYDGGAIKRYTPTYKTVSAGNDGYLEVVKVTFDNNKITYPQLVEYFLHHIDPTNPNGQFCDIGPQYASRILYMNDTQKGQATVALQLVQQKIKPFYTRIIAETTFFPAEEEHQQYYLKNKYRYQFHRWNCGRDAKIKEIWNENK